MLVLTRRIGESVIIDGHIEVKVLDVVGGQVKVGIDAPRNVAVNRKEVEQRVIDQGKRGK